MTNPSMAARLMQQLAKPPQPPRVRPAPAPLPAALAEIAPPVRPINWDTYWGPKRWRDLLYSPTFVPRHKQKRNPLLAVPHAIWSHLTNPRYVGLDRPPMHTMRQSGLERLGDPSQTRYRVGWNPRTWLNNIPRMLFEHAPELAKARSPRALDRTRQATAMALREAPLLGAQTTAAGSLYSAATQPWDPETKAAVSGLVGNPEWLAKALSATSVAAADAGLGLDMKGSAVHRALRDSAKDGSGALLRGLVVPGDDPWSNTLRQMNWLSGKGIASNLAADAAKGMFGAPKPLGELAKEFPAKVRSYSAQYPEEAAQDRSGKSLSGQAVRSVGKHVPGAAALLGSFPERTKEF